MAKFTLTPPNDKDPFKRKDFFFISLLITIGIVIAYSLFLEAKRKKEIYNYGEKIKVENYYDTPHRQVD